MINTWEEFLNTECGCYADENGNRPCDNGVQCDRCLDEKFYENFKKSLDKIREV